MSVGTLFINGRFLTQRITGVQRFGIEVVKALDEVFASQPDLAPDAVLVVPSDVIRKLDLKYIRTEVTGWMSGHLWEQIELPRRTAKGTLLSLCNAGPISHPRQMVVMHDAAVYQEREAYSWIYATVHRALGRLLSRTATIATVSQFSRAELSRILRVPAERIVVAPNGGEHLARIEPDKTILDRLDLAGAGYFLVVGSRAPHKNIGLALAAADRAADWGVKTVLVGEPNEKIFGRLGEAGQSRVIQAGRVSDRELKALYQHALALVFPSRYEGFGIPLLEALLSGCPIIASDIPAVREVCGEGAEYVPVNDLDQLVAAMARRVQAAAQGEAPPSSAAAVAIKFSWRRSAEVLLRGVRELGLSRRHGQPAGAEPAQK